jgi:hypothetical protein
MTITYANLVTPTFERGIRFGPQACPEQGIYEESSTQQYALGTKWVYGDGRVFRYARNGAVALAKALMTQTQVIATGIVAIAQTGHAQTVGATDITVLVTTGSGLAENALVGGTLWCSSVGNVGESYKILASRLDATDTLLHLSLETPLRAAIGATTKISIVPNKYYGVVVFEAVAAVSQTGVATGIPLFAVTASYYCWLQTGGDAPLYVDTDENPAIAELCGPPDTYAVAGAGGVWVTLSQFWGTWRTDNVYDEVGLVGLWLDT